MTDKFTVSSFVRLAQGEMFGDTYYIAHTSKNRFPVQAILVIILGLCSFVFPGIILVLYFAFRRQKISHGYACTTNKRIIYYQFNSHPEENYQAVHTLHLSDLTSVQFKIEQSILSKSFHMLAYSSKTGIQVGASGLSGIFSWFNSSTQMEPGPDAFEFIQVMSGEIAAKKIESLA